MTLEFRFRLTLFPGFPWCGSISACLAPESGAVWVSQVLVRFSPHMPRPRTPTAPQKSRLGAFLVLASVTLTTSPTVFML